MMDRYNIYTFIHKGLRRALFNQLIALGQLDETNPMAVSQCLDATSKLLLCFRQHQQHEDNFIQPLLPLFSQSEQDHYHHEQQLTELFGLIQQIHSMPAVISANALHQLYQQLALFCAGQLQHMHTEENLLMEQLWRSHSDQQIKDVHQQLIQSMSTVEQQQSLSLILPALTDTERLTLLLGIRQQMQESDFQLLFAQVQQELNASQQLKLHTYLDTHHSALCAL